VEATEQLLVDLSNIVASGREGDISFSDPQGVITIENDDSATVGIELSDSVVEAGGSVDLTVTLSSPVDQDVTVVASDVEGTAKVSGSNASEFDYVDVNESLIFSNITASPLELTVSVTVNDEGIVELDETLQVVLSSLVAGGRSVGLANSVSEVTIVNDDSAVVSVTDVIIAEEDGLAILIVELSEQVDVDTTVAWHSIDGSAQFALGDYSGPASGDIVFPALDTSDLTVSITVSDDDIVELAETFHVGIEEPEAFGRNVFVEDADLETGGNPLIVGSGQVTILNTDSATIEINADQEFFVEGDDGITNATLTVTLSNPVDIPILIGYATANGDHHSNENAGIASSSGPEYAGVNSTADNEDPSDPVGQYDFVNSAKVDGHDYDDTEGILNFTAVNNGLINGSSSQTITVPVYGDEVVELDEWLTVAIGTSDVLGRSVTIDKAEDYVWIDNDDEASVSVSDAAIQEGDVGQAYAFIDVTLDNSVDVPLGITYETADGTATSLTTLFNGDEDYVQTSGALSFAGAAGEVVQIQVPINGDRVVELDELFEINLTDVTASNRDVTIGDGQSEVTILNDDSATVLIRDTAVLEGDAGTSTSTATVVLSDPVDVAVSTNYLTVDGTAVESSDYNGVSGSVLFGNLKTDARSFDVNVDILGDEIFERHEVFTVELGILDAGGRSVAYLDTDDASDVEARMDIVNDDRNQRNFIGVCNVVAEPGDVDLDDAVRYAAWNFSVDNEEPVDIQFTAATAAGETLEIGVPQLLDSSGTPIAPGKVDHFTVTDATRSYGVFSVAAGDYTIVVPSGNDSDGLIELAVSLPGILSESDTEVTSHAFQRTAAGVLQSQLGYRGTMPEVFNDLMGIDLAVDQYDACLDADINGMLTMFDLSTVDQNKGSEIPDVSLMEDRFTPAQILDVNPLGAPQLSISDLFGFSIFQNPQNPLDVNGDGHISPIDALVTINSLNDEGSRSVLVLGDNEGDLGNYLDRHQFLYDTNGDFAITPIDVLRVVNALNEAGEAEGGTVNAGVAEGEAITDYIFESFEGVTLKAAGLDSTVAAIASAAEAKDYGQEYYTTPAQQTHWTNAVDAVLEEGSESDDDLEIGGLN